MHSLAAELRELREHAAGDVAAGFDALDGALSVAPELRTTLYAAILLITAGIGLLLRKHLDHIGPLSLVVLLALIACAAYIPAIRARRRGSPPSATADYLLLLAALLVSADLGYAELQWHFFGAHWSWHLLLLSALHGLTAYVLRSQLVLAIALASLAGWFGSRNGPGSLRNLINGESAAPGLGVRALACAAVILVWRAWDERWHAARFRDVFEHFATNLAFWGALG